MEANKVVLRFKNGSLMKGNTSDFFPNKKDFHLTLLDGKIIKIITEDLKAIFFVKDFIGDKNRDKIYTGDVPGGGRKLQVKFPDGEVIIGFSQGYSSCRPGFFIVSADKGENNERVYIVNSATEKVMFL